MAHPMEEIAREGGPEAAGLVAGLMAHSAAEREAIEASVLASVERERDEWRDRALAAEARIAVAENRLLAIFDLPAGAGGGRDA